MITYHVDDMTCGHCASAITRAVSVLDPGACLDLRIPQKLVRITSTASPDALAQAIREAGYTPRRVDEATAEESGQARQRGCGCGCGPQKTTPTDAGAPPAPATRSCCA